MRRIGEHAVVIGASMGGLLAARSLTEAYERVTIVDRDALPSRPRAAGRCRRAATPTRCCRMGRRCLDALLPGFSAELVAAGAPSCAALEEMRFVHRRPSARPRIDGRQLDPRQPARSSRATCAAACVSCRRSR